ncbi:MAG: PQQ-binding-like beta-propeller repeat protein [Halobacteriota archaeon]
MDPSFTTPNGIVYIGSLDHNVYALNVKTGTKVWNYTTGGPVRSSSPVV